MRRLTTTSESSATVNYFFYRYTTKSSCKCNINLGHLPWSMSLCKNINMSNVVVEVPTLLIMGRKDYTLKFPGMEEYLNETKAEDYVPNLETVFLDEGTHFEQGQFPDQVNRLLIPFFNKCQTT
ncbi:hypothetical protein Scep_012582 [Stephania cephalantha]|uniref:Epoxide hydrolase n=1 Tax=Stephania cephalantha TaxID=152367 RepID=A0AAP0JFM7_9MAGN